MTALAYKLHHRSPHSLRRPHLELVAPVVNPRISPQVYRRRRVVAGVLAAVLLVAVASTVSSGLGWLAEQSSTNATASSSAVQERLSEWTVRPGDTLWGIARAVQPEGDVRPLLAKLSSSYKDRPLQIGETITIP